MPTYDYECSKCGHTFDAFQNMSDDPLKKCPECGQNGLKRLIGGGLGIIFKGSGFYATDSRSSSSTATTSSESKSADTGSSGDGSGSKAPGGDSKEKSGTSPRKTEKVAG